MQIKPTYARLEKITFSFTEAEVKRLLIQDAKRHKNVSANSTWEMEIYENDDGDLIVDLIQTFITPLDSLEDSLEKIGD